MSRVFLALFLLLACASAHAQGHENSSAVTAARVTAAEARAKSAEKQDRESRRQALLLQAKSELEDKAYARLEILLALFALLLTILVIWFGIRTEKAAATAAKGELADRQKELDEIMIAARAAGKAADEASVAARTAAGTAETYATTAADHSAKAAEGAQTIMMAVTGVVQSQQDKAAEAEVAREAAATPRGERSPEEFRALIDEAREAGRWLEIIDLAQGMRFLHRDDPYSVSFSLLQEGFGLSRLNRPEESMQRYVELADRFAGSDIADVQSNVASGIINKALENLRQHNYDESLKDFETAIGRFHKSSDSSIKDKINSALLWKAVVFVVQADKKRVMAALDAWKERLGGFDCQQVRENVFFKRLKGDSEFQDYLKANGCESE